MIMALPGLFSNLFLPNVIAQKSLIAQKNLYSKTGVYRGIHYFSYFCSKTKTLGTR